MTPEFVRPTNPDIRILNAGDLPGLCELIAIFEQEFAMEDFARPDDAHLLRCLADERFIAVVATVGQAIVGGLTAYVLPQYYSTRPLAYIFDLAVTADHQRRGIGSRLIRALNEHCRSIGCSEVFVQADLEDTHALDFYRSTGASGEESVVHYTYALSAENLPQHEV